MVLAPGRVFVGLGARSSREGIDWLAAVLQKRNIKREIIIVPHDVLHLDCCWNVIDSNLALWCEEATGPFMDLNGKKPPPRFADHTRQPGSAGGTRNQRVNGWATADSGTRSPTM